MATKRNHGSKGRGDGGSGRAPGRDQQLAATATSQGGVVSLDQLGEVGISPRSASRRSEKGSLHRVHRGVYAVGHRSVSWQAELRAALLACGEAAVISHGTAAALWGLWDKTPALIDVTVPVEAGRKVGGVRCRRCRYPLAEEVTECHGITCTTPARVFVDLAGMFGLATVRQTVERAAVLKLLDVDAVYRAVHFAKGRPGLRGLTAVLDAWNTSDGKLPDVRSDFEALVLPRLVSMGLPRPVCNETLAVGGERLMVDFLWRRQLVVVETDGAATHQTAVAFQRDRHRDQLLIAAGYRVPRVTWDQIKHELDAVVARIARTLVLAGT
jgi:Transcriptional regulator, AbiEi antitoxin/Protein of unknown function (DUF559)/AbiEi antitoxin C-terminal domain